MSPLRLLGLGMVVAALYLVVCFFQPLRVAPFSGATLLVYNERGEIEKSLLVDGLQDESALSIVTTTGDVFGQAQENIVLIYPDGTIRDHRSMKVGIGR